MNRFFAQACMPPAIIDDIRQACQCVPIERFTRIEIAQVVASALLVIIVICLGIYFYTHYHKHKTVTPPLTPLQIAQHDLNLLKTHPPATDALWSQSMSKILRSFLEKTYYIHALESTTEELRNHLKCLAQPLAHNFIHILERCDFARFAAKPLSDAGKAELIALAQEIICSVPNRSHVTSPLSGIHNHG